MCPNTYSWKDNFVLTCKTAVLWFIYFVLNRIKFTLIIKFPKYLKESLHNTLWNILICTKNFEFYNYELGCGFDRLNCFIIAKNTDMTWNPAEFDYFTLLNNLMVIVDRLKRVYAVSAIFQPHKGGDGNCIIFYDQCSYYIKIVNKKVNPKIL